MSARMRPRTPIETGLPLSQEGYDTKRKHQEWQRNRDYNEMLVKVDHACQEKKSSSWDTPVSFEELVMRLSPCVCYVFFFCTDDQGHSWK